MFGRPCEVPVTKSRRSTKRCLVWRRFRVFRQHRYCTTSRQPESSNAIRQWGYMQILFKVVTKTVPIFWGVGSWDSANINLFLNVWTTSRWTNFEELLLPSPAISQTHPHSVLLPPLLGPSVSCDPLGWFSHLSFFSSNIHLSCISPSSYCTGS